MSSGRQKKLQASSGLSNTATQPRLAELAAALAPRAARYQAARARVDDPVALRKLFADQNDIQEEPSAGSAGQMAPACNAEAH